MTWRTTTATRQEERVKRDERPFFFWSGGGNYLGDGTWLKLYTLTR